MARTCSSLAVKGLTCSFRSTERTYLVTGGGSGIGKGVAAGLVAAGAAVMIVGRNPDRLAAAVEEIEAGKAGGGEIRYEPADITDEDEATRAVDCSDGLARPAARGGALRRRIRDHRADHPDRLGVMATDHRPQRQRHHVRAQALRTRDGARWRRFVRRHLVDRGQQHPPLVRRLRRRQVGAGPPDAVGRRRTRRVVGAGQQHPPGADPHRAGCSHT